MYLLRNPITKRNVRSNLVVVKSPRELGSSTPVRCRARWNSEWRSRASTGQAAEPPDRSKATHRTRSTRNHGCRYTARRALPQDTVDESVLLLTPIDGLRPDAMARTKPSDNLNGIVVLQDRDDLLVREPTPANGVVPSRFEGLSLRLVQFSRGGRDNAEQYRAEMVR